MYDENCIRHVLSQCVFSLYVYSPDSCHSCLQVRKLFQQLFSFVNVQLFNQLLLRRECCSFSNGEYVKTGLAEVENWIHSAGKDWTGESWDELRYIRQVLFGLHHAFLDANFCSKFPAETWNSVQHLVLPLACVIFKHALCTPGELACG